MVDRRAPEPKFSDKKAICDPLPTNPMDDMIKPTSPIKMQSPDRADAPPFVFADDEMCVERQPVKTYVRADGSMSPASAAAAARRQEKCRLSPGESPKQAEMPAKCKRFSEPRCKPEKLPECPPMYMYDEFSQPPTETCEERLTKPMRLPALRVPGNVPAADVVYAL